MVKAGAEEPALKGLRRLYVRSPGRPYRRNRTRQYRKRNAANRRANRRRKTFSSLRRTSYQISFAPPYRDCIDLGSGPEVAKFVSHGFTFYYS